MNKKRRAIIIFTRNPELGKVKTRLAKTIGDQNALRIYKMLIEHTVEIIGKVETELLVFYTEHIPTSDSWDELNPKRLLQQGDDLGERMHNAFLESFKRGYEQVLIIGTDIYLQSSSNLDRAFEQLEAHDVVINPVRDGGYCLLGLKEAFPEIFLDKQWSHEKVYEQSVDEIRKKNLTYFELPLLIDVDNEQDMIDSGIELS